MYIYYLINESQFICEILNQLFSLHVWTHETSQGIAIMSFDTYLSDYVYHIIVKGSKICQKCSRSYLMEDLTYHWSEISHVLGEITDDFDVLDQSEIWYLEKTQILWDIIHNAGSAVTNATVNERASLYQFCDWIDFNSDIIEYALSPENIGKDGPLLAVLVLTASLERALGNVFMTKNQNIPFLLRDLLKTPELTCIFGKIPIVFTQLLVGCPRGFNLRNVSWHGFISPGEIHPHLVTGLIVLIASLGKTLLHYQVLPKRPQFTSFESYQKLLTDLFPETFIKLEEVEALIEKSHLIPNNQKILWRKVYYLFQMKRYGFSLVLLMPLLEQCLRILYCRINNCPDRLLTAESTVFYTTLDEILTPSQSQVISNGLLMLLLDLTSSLSGPRVRDRLSHGEVQLSSVPWWLVNLILGVALAAAHSFHTDKENNCEIPACALLLEVTSGYQSRFHIVASLHRKLVSLLDEWISWQQQCSPPPDVTVQTVSCHLIHDLDQLMFPDGGNVPEKLLKVKKVLDECELRTLYRPKSEMEYAVSLANVVSYVTRTAEKVGHTVESRRQLWCDRELRSRARATALRMWSVLPDIWTAMLCIVMVVTSFTRHLPHLALQGKPVSRLVKTLTKAVENTVTLCDADKNRWIEAHQILTNMADECLKFFIASADYGNNFL